MATRIKRKFADIVALIPGKCTLRTEAHKATVRKQTYRRISSERQCTRA